MTNSTSIRDNVITTTTPEHSYPNDNMVKYLFEKFKQWPQREILVDGKTGKTYTAEEFQLAVLTVSENLVNHFGLVNGDVVCFQCENSDLFLIGLIGVIAAGGIATSCPATVPYYELHNNATKTKPKFLVISKDTLENALRLAEECHQIKNIFVIDDDQSFAKPNVRAFKCLLDNSSSNALNQTPVTVNQDDVCVILFSSGTSGVPKPVPRTHKNMLANANCNENSYDFAVASDVTSIPWSLCHSSQMKLIVTCLVAGSKIIIFEDTGIEVFCNHVQKYRITKAVLVPSYIIQMVKTGTVDHLNLSSLQDVFSTGSILPEDMALAFIEKFNVKYLRQVYGASEVSTCVMQRKIDYSIENLKCSGIPVPGCSVKIVDVETNISLGPNCVGELYTKGPCTMPGYLNMPHENERAFDVDGYYKTGDAAYYDATGRIFIVDRYKNILKYEGCAISCVELESILINHPQIRDVCVVGIEHDVYGEVPLAIVVIDHGELSQRNVIDFLSSHVTDYKRLNGGVIFVDKILKNSLGKVRRSKLAAMYNAKGTTNSNDSTA